MEEPKEPQNPNFSGTKLAGLALDFAAIIALPLLAGIYAGRWLDEKQGSEYWVIVGILLAIGISSLLIYKRIKTVSDQLKK